MASNPTADDIISKARGLLREDSGSDVPAISDPFMLDFLSDANLKWADAFSTSGNDPVVFQRTTGIELIAETSLNATANSASTSLTLKSSAALPVSGTVILWRNIMPDVVPYTGNDLVTQLTGVSGIGFNHSVGDEVQAIYALPANFGAFRQADGYGDGVMLNSIPLSYMGGFPTPGFFSKYDDGTTQYLILPRQSTGECSVLYDKISSDIDTTDDTVDVPAKYKYYLIYHCMAMAYVGREDDYNKMIAAKKESEAILQRALMNRNTRRVIRTRPFGAIATRDFTVIGGNTIPLN